MKLVRIIINNEPEGIMNGLWLLFICVCHTLFMVENLERKVRDCVKRPAFHSISDCNANLRNLCSTECEIYGYFGDFMSHKSGNSH
jgi:hypothetical protein